MSPLLTNSASIMRVKVEGLRKLVKYLKLVSNPNLLSHQDLIDVLCCNGYFQTKVKVN